jgi:hypothetical protein
VKRGSSGTGFCIESGFVILYASLEFSIAREFSACQSSKSDLGVTDVFPDAAQRFGGVGKARRANLPAVFACTPAAALRDLRSLTETLLPHPGDLQRHMPAIGG